METNREHRVSKKYAKKHFSAVGSFLILYTLLVLIFPYMLHLYMVQSDSPILKDELLYFGIYFIIILFGTLIPFFLMRLFFKMPFKKMVRSIDATFLNLFVQTIVFFTICVILTYVANMIANNIGMPGKLIASIGFSYDDGFLNNPLYVFMLLVVTPIIEEYAFRGVLLNILGKYGKTFALYASAIFFALAHTSFAEMIPAFAMGVSLGKTSLRYKSIVPTIVIHILFNVFIYALCIIPPSIARYMAYGFAGIFVFTMFLVLTGRYESVKIQKLRSAKTTNILFYTRATVILCMMLMIANTILFTFFN